MNRLQKKCFIVTAGGHLLLLLVLVFGAAFFNPKPKEDDSQLLDIIPDIDATLNSGNRSAQSPPLPPIPQPPQPQQIVKPPAPAPQPQKIETPEPVKPTEPDVVKPPQHQINVDLTKVTHTAPKNPPAKPQDDSRQQQQRIKAIQDAARSLKNNLTSATEVSLPGDSASAKANYASVVRSIYYQAWIPDDVAAENEVVKITVTIASDGTVINARIIASSGDANLDASVQRTLERVKVIAPFPAGMDEKEWTRTISFNPDLKKSPE